MRKSILKNYLYNLSYQLIILLTPLVTMPYISRVLGADGIGMYSYTTSIVTYFVLLAALGLSDYGQREIAYHQGDRYAQSRILYEVSIFRCVTVFLSFILYYFIIVRNSGLNNIILIIQSINIIALLFDVSWFFQGLEDFEKIVIRNIIIRFISIVLLFIFVKKEADLWIYIMINSSAALIGGGLVCCFLPKYIVKVPIKKINPFRNYKIIIQLFLPQIAIQIYMVLDKTMIGLYSLSLAENGFYEQATKCIRMAQMIIGSLGVVFMSRVAYAYENKDLILIKNTIMKCYKFVWAVGLPLVLLIIFISPLFIPCFLGRGFEKTIILLQFLSPLIIIIGFSGITGRQYLIPTKQEKKLTYSVVLGLLVNVSLNAVFIPKFYSIGAVYSSLIAEITVTFFQFYLIRDVFEVRKIFSLIRYYCPAIIVTTIVLTFLSEILLPSFMSSCIALSVGIFVYISLLIYFKDEFAMIIIKKSKVFLARRKNN